jgi:predicted DsbA family dithiol-disulfide isomerase
MSVEVYSDFVCPWCYIAHQRLQTALSEIPHGSRPEITWRSYQLDPKASKIPDLTAAQAMLGWYPSLGEAEMRIARIISSGRDEGLHLDLHHALPVNTFDAHRLSHFAKGTRLTDAMRERLFRAYHKEGLNIADPDVLTKIAVDVGFYRTEVDSFLLTDRFSEAVQADIDRGSQKGIRGVPHIVMDGGQPVSALQQGSELVKLLARKAQ